MIVRFRGLPLRSGFRRPRNGTRFITNLQDTASNILRFHSYNFVIRNHENSESTIHIRCSGNLLEGFSTAVSLGRMFWIDLGICRGRQTFAKTKRLRCSSSGNIQDNLSWYGMDWFQSGCFFSNTHNSRSYHVQGQPMLV